MYVILSGHSYTTAMFIFNCICPLFRAEDTVISSFPPNFRVCFLCDLQQNCPTPVTPVLVPRSDSIQNWPGAQLMFLSNGSTQHRIYASSAFTAIFSPAPEWQIIPNPRQRGISAAQILLDPFSNFWVNHNKLNTPMHHFYPALEASQPADQRLSAWYCCWTCMDTPVHQAFLLCGICMASLLVFLNATGQRE